ncbi:M24 family metallopeptidase [Liquorilactobacillus oeni]|uniref:Xaa-Pro dipeptidase n=1 Tax=Liquorilactobacillus oeni DSM 19972 TaxID=1423777 RepID=A0A0R1MK24_9LACO|nr:aminopeptidase P family protein [Liquorilactobacillus oeni]KRL04248.1 Xaa-Pro dipeptidase [Liquorilactobacillus oeni DSM 19972]
MQLERVVKLRSEMEKMSVDAFLITNPVNIFYLSGFTGDAGVALVTEDNQYLITDSRFGEQIKSQVKYWSCEITREYLKTACHLVTEKHLLAMAFEGSLSYNEYEVLDENAVSDIVAFDGVIEKLRSVKDTQEIALLRKSCSLAGLGYQKFLETVAKGQTEIEAANELDYIMKKLGAAESSFSTIVASGNRSSLPHGTASMRKLRQNDIVTLDFGYFYQGYTSDVTRTFSIGPQISDVRDTYQTVLRAQEKTIEAIRPGITGSQLDRIGRSLITEAGYGKFFNHGMGHGIGMSIHELPNIGMGYEDILVPGQVITIEPGVYIPNKAGIRIEDDVLVTESGYEILTDFSKEYFEIKG